MKATSEAKACATSLELTSNQQATKSTIQSEDEVTVGSSAKENPTNLNSTEGKHQESHVVKVDVKSTNQGAVKETFNMFETTTIMADAKVKTKREDTQKKEAFMRTKPTSDDKVEAKSSSSTSHRIFLDLENGDKVKVRCLTLLDSEVKHNMMSYGTWILLEKPSLVPAPKQVATSNHTFGECLGVAKATLNIEFRLVTDEFLCHGSK